MGASGPQRETFVIRDLGALKAFADPLRNRIVGLLDTARTVRDLADRLDRPADRLYYHLRLLEQHGIVRASSERGEERRYVLSAESFVVDPALTMPTVAVEKLVAGILETVGREYGDATRRRQRAQRRGGADGEKRSMLALRHVVLDDDERRRVVELLQEIGREHERRGNGVPGARKYGIVTGIWPVDEDRADEEEDA